MSPSPLREPSSSERPHWIAGEDGVVGLRHKVWIAVVIKVYEFGKRPVTIIQRLAVRHFLRCRERLIGVVPKDSQVILLAALNAGRTYDEVQIAVAVEVCQLHIIPPEALFQPLGERYSGLLETGIAAVVEQIQAVVIRTGR